MRPPRASALTFLVFSDAITGMIGVLLVVLVIARPPTEQQMRLEQADRIVWCLATTPAIMLSLADTSEPISLAALLANSHTEGRMTLRIAVVESPQPETEELACIAALRTAVDDVNQRYETFGSDRRTIDQPYIFLTMLPAETRTSQ